MASRKSKAKDKSGLWIAPAKKGDEEIIARLIAALAEYEKAPEENKATPELVREQLFGKKPVAEALIARIGDEAVGFALYFPNFSTWLCRPGMFLEDLFVVPEHRRKGVARALFRHLAQICVERGYGRFEWACLEWNELAKGMYRRIGAEPLEEWRTWRLTGEGIERLAAEPPEDDPGKTNAETNGESLPDSHDRVVIYTDGGSQPNPGTGAWAAVMSFRGTVKELVGGELQTTNNRMELSAAINALEALKRPCKVMIYTDSQYVRRGITEWIHKWKRKNWMRNKDEPVLNVDLWKRLDAAIARHDIEWKWVRGHTGNKLNERCDELCGEEIARLRKAAGETA